MLIICTSHLSSLLIIIQIIMLEVVAINFQVPPFCVFITNLHGGTDLKS